MRKAWFYFYCLLKTVAYFKRLHGGELVFYACVNA